MPTRRIMDVLGHQELVELPPDASVSDAARAMTARRVGAVLVKDGDTLAGIFTERDVVERVVALRRNPVATPLWEVMTAKPIVASWQSTVLDVLRLMRLHRMRHLPIERDGAVIGIVSLRDFVAEDIAAFEHDHPLAG